MASENDLDNDLDAAEPSEAPAIPATLPLEARIQALERFENGPLGIAMFAVKTLLCFIWYEHPDSAIEAGLVKNVRALARPRVRGAR